MIRLRILALAAPALAASVLLAACNTTGVFPSQSGKDWKDVDENGVPLQTGAAQCKDQAKLNAKIATGVAQQAEVAGGFSDPCIQDRGS
jgi:predicted small secreted protein